MSKVKFFKIRKSFTLSKSNGFGLLEVVFASSILIMFLVAGLLLIRGSSRNTVTGKDRLSALTLASRKVEAVRAWRDSNYFSTSVTGDINWSNLPVDLMTVKCYDINSNEVTCPGFFTVTPTLTDINLAEMLKKYTITITWTEYGVTKTASLFTYVKGCSQTMVPVATVGPADIINVIDITGSMSSYWGSGPPACGGSGTTCEQKIHTARDVLTVFNNQVAALNASSGINSRVGLASFPDCQSALCTKWFGQVRSALTTNIPAVNAIIATLGAGGNTPLADGIKKAISVIDTNSTHPRAIIVASDGLANVNLNGNSDPTSTPANQAIVQANIAREAPYNATIFAIAIGNDFNPTTLQAIASNQGVCPYFYVANDPNGLNDVFNTIFEIVSKGETTYICPEESWPPPPPPAPGVCT